MVFSSNLSARFFQLLVSIALAEVLSAQSAEPPSDETCITGPSTLASSHIFVNGRQYFSDAADVECNGTVTSWFFCHYVIGFRLQQMELWPGVWRRDGDEFNLVGLNMIVLEPPGFGEQFRCMNYQVDAADWFQAKEGDYVGFYVPDNGVFIASATAQSDPGRHQLQRDVYGFAENFTASELNQAASSFGRAIIRALIDPSPERPVITDAPIPPSTPPPSPTPSPPPPILPTTTPTILCSPPASDPPVLEAPVTGNGGLSATEIAVPVVAVVSLAIIIVLLVIISVLVVLLKRRRSEAVLQPLPYPLARTVDATNPTTGTSDNGSVLYEAIYSKAYIQDTMTDGSEADLRSETGYSMISNPAYLKGDSLSRGNPTFEPASPPVSNPTYGSSAATGSLIRYPQVAPRSKKTKKTATFSGPFTPTSPPPSSPAPVCPAPPPPPAPYSSSFGPKYSRPPKLSLRAPPTGPPLTVLPTVPQSPPSPYSNPYKTPRPVSPNSIYTSITEPQTISASSTMTTSSDQSSEDVSTVSTGLSSADTNHTSHE